MAQYETLDLTGQCPAPPSTIYRAGTQPAIFSMHGLGSRKEDLHNMMISFISRILSPINTKGNLERDDCFPSRQIFAHPATLRSL
ncbi:hypothetical protein CNMCM5793_001788 [Aspergillus hiratsukae]|uniref:Uncharacterized protein n=1 Tax=Aspergillus hiratsukae TaxID=1194566 RepID=A0A8H6Q6L3_9EURO|nr:hypothetical protein CNMCM5793_001788 [Aspergillus hiratsukae]KAF7166491.1 hypothetical protein CNMCM6106_002302 [Aspergillus hiratsukae]